MKKVARRPWRRRGGVRSCRPPPRKSWGGRPSTAEQCCVDQWKWASNARRARPGGVRRRTLESLFRRREARVDDAEIVAMRCICTSRTRLASSRSRLVCFSKHLTLHQHFGPIEPRAPKNLVAEATSVSDTAASGSRCLSARGSTPAGAPLTDRRRALVASRLARPSSSGCVLSVPSRRAFARALSLVRASRGISPPPAARVPKSCRAPQPDRASTRPAPPTSPQDVTRTRTRDRGAPARYVRLTLRCRQPWCVHLPPPPPPRVALLLGNNRKHPPPAPSSRATHPSSSSIAAHAPPRPFPLSLAPGGGAHAGRRAADRRRASGAAADPNSRDARRPPPKTPKTPDTERSPGSRLGRGFRRAVRRRLRRGRRRVRRVRERPHAGFERRHLRGDGRRLQDDPPGVQTLRPPRPPPAAPPTPRSEEESVSFSSRKLWIARVPPPPAADAAHEADVEAKEARVTALTKTIDSAMATLRACREAREEAQSSLVAVRARGCATSATRFAKRPPRRSRFGTSWTRRPDARKSSSCEGASWGGSRPRPRWMRRSRRWNAGCRTRVYRCWSRSACCGRSRRRGRSASPCRRSWRREERRRRGSGRAKPPPRSSG